MFTGVRSKQSVERHTYLAGAKKVSGTFFPDTFFLFQFSSVSFQYLVPLIVACRASPFSVIW